MLGALPARRACGSTGWNFEHCSYSNRLCHLAAAVTQLSAAPWKVKLAAQSIWAAVVTKNPQAQVRRAALGHSTSLLLQHTCLGALGAPQPPVPHHLWHRPIKQQAPRASSACTALKVFHWCYAEKTRTPAAACGSKDLLVSSVQGVGKAHRGL